MIISLLLLLALTPPSPADSRFGVVVLTEGRTLAQVEADLTLAEQLGVGWVRLTPDWIRLAPEAKKLDWSFTDAVVQAAGKHHLKVLYTLGNTPRWASKYPQEAEAAVWSRNAPKNPADWAAYVAALVARPQWGVQAWQVWERTSVHYFRGGTKDLVALAQGAMQAVRARDRNAVVLMPEPGGINLGAINGLYTFGAQTWFSGLALFPAGATPEANLRPLQVLQRDIVAKKGPGMRLWVAGTGWDVETSTGPVKSTVVDENEQARFLVRMTTLALANGVEKVFWQTLRDAREGPYQAQSHSGLLTVEGRERPAWAAYQTLLKALGNRPFLQAARWGPHAHGYLFGEKGQEAVLVAWSDGPEVGLAPYPAAEILRGKDPARLTGDPVVLKGSEPLLRAWAETAAVAPAPADPDRSGATQVSATPAGQDGLALRTPRESLVLRDEGWSTDLVNGKSQVAFDIDDTFAYFVDGRFRVEVEVEARAATSSVQTGFNLGYDALAGYSFTPWQWLEGTAWQTVRFDLKDADLSDAVSDLRVNALGSKGDVIVRAVRVRKYITK